MERTQVHQIQVGSCLFLMLFLYLKLTQQAKTKLFSFKSNQTKYLNIKPKKKKKKNLPEAFAKHWVYLALKLQKSAAQKIKNNK